VSRRLNELLNSAGFGVSCRLNPLLDSAAAAAAPCPCPAESVNDRLSRGERYVPGPGPTAAAPCPAESVRPTTCCPADLSPVPDSSELRATRVGSYNRKGHEKCSGMAFPDSDGFWTPNINSEYGQRILLWPRHRMPCKSYKVSQQL